MRICKEPNFTTKQMISIFPLWTFHLYVATFHRHMYMEYISKGSLWLIWSHRFQSFTDATMTCLPITDDITYKWPHTCSVCRNQKPVISPFRTYPRVCSNSNTTCFFYFGHCIACPLWFTASNYNIGILRHFLLIFAAKDIYIIWLSQSLD